MQIKLELLKEIDKRAYLRNNENLIDKIYRFGM